MYFSCFEFKSSNLGNKQVNIVSIEILKKHQLTSYFGTRFSLEYLINLVLLLAPFDLERLDIFVFRNFFLTFVIDDL